MAFSDASTKLITRPAGHAFAITPNDSADLANITRGLYVGSAGNLKATTEDGDTVTFNGLLAGVVYPFRLKRIFSTDTTASSLIGLY